MRKYLFFYLVIFSLEINAQGKGPIVPSQMQFADVHLKINEGARKQIQEDVDALVASASYFEAKVDKARLYFPIIERVFEEENLPEDFKYLVIQESDLVADAVSVSNAVGYWQFKDFTAEEMGLRVDKNVDERMNIVSSTRAAAKYLKKNNFYFDNWIYALQAYQMGAGGVQKAEDTRYFGARSMTITKKTYWYVKKYLAHRIAYEYGLNQPGHSALELVEYTRGANKDMKELSKELMIPSETLTSYNKWLLKGPIPDDKIYSVIIPVESGSKLKEDIVASSFIEEQELTPPTYEGVENPGAFPKISDSKGIFQKPSGEIKVNNIPGIVFGEGSDLQTILAGAGISEHDFRKYNEILPHDQLVIGQVYYFKKKKAKAKAHYHTVINNESLWSISQKYGVRLSKLIKKNRLADENDVQPGMVIWLRYIRPEDEPIRFKEISPIVIDHIDKNEVQYLAIQETSAQELEDKMLEPERFKEVQHLVKAKESFYRIANIYQVEVLELVNYNDLTVSDGLQVGQVLNVRVPFDFELSETEDITELTKPTELTELTELTKSNLPVVYTVKSGDTFYSIADKFGISVDTLMKLNNKQNSDLSVGDQLTIR